MKLAILSDIHNNLPNLEKALDFCLTKNVDAIIGCGDWGDLKTWKLIAKTWTKPIYAVCGNLDADNNIFQTFPREQFPHLQLFDRTAEIILDNKKIGLVHWPEFAQELIKRNDVVFYGHTHKPWEEMIGNCLFLNPGNIANQFYKSTFAVYDTKDNQRSLIILDHLQT
jgi:hypothetical protein